MGPGATLFFTLLAAVIALLAGPIGHLVRIGGVFLSPAQTILEEDQGPIFINDTLHCEDVHYYRPANVLFTACEDDKSTRFSWFPPLGNLFQMKTRGSFHIVDPKVISLCTRYIKGGGERARERKSSND